DAHVLDAVERIEDFHNGRNRDLFAFEIRLLERQVEKFAVHQIGDQSSRNGEFDIGSHDSADSDANDLALVVDNGTAGIPFVNPSVELNLFQFAILLPQAGDARLTHGYGFPERLAEGEAKDVDGLRLVQLGVGIEGNRIGKCVWIAIEFEQHQ